MPDEPSELTQQLESMQTVLLSRMEEMINSKMETVHDSLASQQRHLAAVQVDKINDIKFGSAHKFKKRGNEEQFKVNAQVEEKLLAAKRAIEKEDKGEALAAVEEGASIVKERQRLILLADSSDLGWAVVKEYAKNELAEDSEDEKRILRATARAEKKFKQQRGKKGARFAPYSVRPLSGAVGQSSSNGTRPKPGACFTRGASGHWSRECPRNGPVTASKAAAPGQDSRA